MKHSVFALVTLFVSFLFFAGVLIYFLPNDFWQDEVYTLSHFVFVSTATTATDYYSTNNHVLFSLFCNLLRQILGFKQLSDVLLHPYFLRSVPVIISLAAVLIFYKKTANRYGKEAAIICSSVWLSTFPLLCFASQFRGYSLSILLVTLQYFSFSKIVKSERITFFRCLILFLLSSLSLLCLPTNIYIEASYLLLCLMLFVIPSFSTILFDTSITKINLIKIISAIAAGCLWTSLYYRWMLMQQPQNEFITTFHPFAVENLTQSLSIFYRFSGYRLYLPLFLILPIILFIKRMVKKEFSYTPVLLPFLLFFIPFVFFFIHGAIIIQRTFLSLIPFFCLMTGLALQSFSGIRFYKPMYNLIMLLNLVCIIITFVLFVNVSKKNNIVENHQQDLVQHYYLVHFNALQTTQLAKKMTAKNGYPLYLDDGFGQTGIDYYLSAFQIPFTRISDSTVLPDHCLILTNLKKKTTGELIDKERNYHQWMQPNEQYNLFESDGMKGKRILQSL